MKTLLNGITKNVLLIIGGFLACLTGNFFFGALIGAGAGALHCCFGGALSRKGMKDAIFASLPIAIVVAVLCGVGAQFSGGFTSFGGAMITIIVTFLCGFVGSFIGGSKYYQEQTREAPQRHEMDESVQSIAENNNAPENVDANDYINHMRAHRNNPNIQKADTAVPNDYDEMIDVSKASKEEKCYYDLVKELTGKKVVTKRIIDEAYTKLPEDIKQMYANDSPKVALTSYALDRYAERQKELDSPYTKTVKQLSGMSEVTEEAINKAYENIPDSAKQDLPADKQNALMFYASGKTLSGIKSDAEKEQSLKEEQERREIENYYLAIPAGQKVWLPDDHAEAVAMFKRHEFLRFYDTLPEEYKAIPEYVYNSLCSCPPDQDINTYMLYNRENLMSQFCLQLQYPLSVIPLCVLAEFTPPASRFGKTDLEVVKEMEDTLLHMFSAELPEPLNRVPIKALWLSLPARDRLHENMKLNDIKLHLEELKDKFAIDGSYGNPLILILPVKLRNISLSDLRKQVRNTNASPIFDVINNLDKLMIENIGNTSKGFSAYGMCKQMSISTIRYLLDWGLDFEHDDMPDDEFAATYATKTSELFNTSLPAPLCDIPLPMFRYLLSDLSIINDSNKTEMAIINDYVSEHSAKFTEMFKGNNVIPKCALAAWTEEQLSEGVSYEIDNEVADEVWRAWLPPDIRNASYADIDAICSGLDSAPNPEFKILQESETLANILRQKEDIHA